MGVVAAVVAVVAGVWRGPIRPMSFSMQVYGGRPHPELRAGFERPLHATAKGGGLS